LWGRASRLAVSVEEERIAIPRDRRPQRSQGCSRCRPGFPRHRRSGPPAAAQHRHCGAGASPARQCRGRKNRVSERSWAAPVPKSLPLPIPIPLPLPELDPGSPAFWGTVRRGAPGPSVVPSAWSLGWSLQRLRPRRWAADGLLPRRERCFRRASRGCPLWRFSGRGWSPGRASEKNAKNGTPRGAPFSESSTRS